MSPLIVIDQEVLAKHKRTLTTIADEEYLELSLPVEGGAVRVREVFESFAAQWRLASERDELDLWEFIARIGGVERLCAASQDVSIGRITHLFEKTGETATARFGDIASPRSGEVVITRLGEAMLSRSGEVAPARSGETGRSRAPEAVVLGAAATWHDLAAACRDRAWRSKDRAEWLRRMDWSDGLAGRTLAVVREKSAEASRAALRAADAHRAAGDAVEAYALALEAVQKRIAEASDLYLRAESLAVSMLASARDAAGSRSLWDGLAPVPRTRDGVPWSPAVDYVIGAGRAQFYRVIDAARSGVDKARFRSSLASLVEGLESDRLDPSEINAAIANLAGGDARRFNDELEAAKHRSRSTSLTSRFSSAVLSSASNSAEVKILTEKLGALEPTPKPGKSTGWMTLARIDLDDIRHDDVNQGALGDCWLLSGLGAQTAADPTVIRQRIRKNPNGTFTVTLFKHGVATDVTVSAGVPCGANGVAFAGGGMRGRDPNWVSIFEKAAAQLIGEGQYVRIEKGIGSSGIAVVSGPGASTYGPFSLPGQPYLSLDDIKSMVESKRPIVPMTGLAWNDPSITDAHAYYVVGIADGGRIVVRNPWGERGSREFRSVLYLTEEQFNKKFITAAAGD